MENDNKKNYSSLTGTVNERHKRQKTRRTKKTNWQKLDNTANLFPAIATHTMTNVYRISVDLDEDIDRAVLQKALDMVLPDFDTFNVHMRRGVFWYYFETNNKKPPLVEKESDYPCRYIEPYANNNYLFRVTYYKKRINLEVFHVLADGMGGINFLRELAYQYLRLKHPEIAKEERDGLSDATSLNTEDSYLKNYRKSHAKGYKTARAFEVKGEKLLAGALGVIHGIMPLDDIKKVCKGFDASINEYLVGVMTYSVYCECLHRQPCTKPVVTCVPVNLRPYFNSMTTRNFFVMVSALFEADRDDYTFEEVLLKVKNSLRSQINKENLEKLFSYNVSNQKNLLLRFVPFVIKKLAMRFVYRSSARAGTTTLTNIGSVEIDDAYRDYIRRFSTMISVSTGQNIKGAVVSYNGELVFTFASTLADVSIQKHFFNLLAKHGIQVTIESNGVYYE
ncbi:MAG TPA: hypothetical protein DCZ23_03770 [Lachnospiraceae bacterium]|nr:hypothetical protein [Lachnospiraceae bacterium]